MEVRPHPRCSRRCRATIRGVRAFSVVAAALASAAAAPALADAPTTVPRTGVLVLHSYHEGLTWTDGADQGIRETFAPRTDIEVYTEYLDTKRVSQDERLDLFAQYLALKYADTRIALVIVSDNDALAFLARYERDTFSERPVVFCGIDDFRPALLEGLDGPATGVVQALDPRGTVALIRTLQPGVQRLAIVSGIDSTAVAIRRQTRAAIEKMPEAPPAVWLSGLATGELVARLRELTANDAVLICNFNRDADGVYYSHEDAARLISRASLAPVYAMQDLYVGAGAVGGSVISSRDQGRMAARLGLEILDTREVPQVLWNCPNLLLCDHAALVRLGLDASRLPPDAQVINRPVSFYERHRRLIWSTLAAFALLVLALAGVIWGLLRTRRAAREVRRSEDNLRTTLNSIGDGVIATDAAGRVVHLNPVAERLTGWSAGEAMDLPLATVFTIVDTQTRRPAAAPVAAVLERGEVVALSNHTTLLARDGAEYQIADSAAPIRGDEGTITGVVLVFRDVTEEYRMRRRIAESDEQTKLALRGADLGTWDWNLTAGTVTVDARSAEMLGAERREYVAPTDFLRERVHPDDLPGLRAAMDAHLRGEAASFEAEHRVRHGADDWLWLLNRGRVIERGPDGAPLRVCGTYLNITDRKRAEAEREKLAAQLRQAQRMESIGLLAGGVAHDFNNILTAIAGHTELAIAELREHFPGAGSAVDELREVETSVARAADLTRQLLAFGRRQMIRPVVLDLNAKLRDLEKMLQRLISESIALRIHCAPDLHAIEADPGQLEQVIVNLVVNARDAMPGGGRLDLVTSNVLLDATDLATNPEGLPGPHVLLSVTDTGCGMDQATRERMFDPFFTTKPVGQGTGLGLATVYGIVKQAGGTIDVRTAPGQGATFKIYWPAAPDAPIPQERPHATSSALTGSETVLACEDDPAVRGITARILAAAGYTVLLAQNAEDALRRAGAHPDRIDLLITDVIMPDMNGRDLADALAAVRPGLRILFVSGYAATAIAHHGVLEAGVEFLEKPFSRQQLLQRVREVLDRAVAEPHSG